MQVKKRLRGWRLPAAGALALAAVSAGVAQAVVAPGGQPETAYVGDIQVGGPMGPVLPIKAFHWGLTQGVCGGGGGCGKLGLADIQISRPINITTPGLTNDLYQAIHLPSAVVRLYAPGSANPFVQYSLTDIAVTGEGTATGKGGLTVERVALAPAKYSVAAGLGPLPSPADPADVVGTLRVDGIAQPVTVLGHSFSIALSNGVVSKAPLNVVAIAGGAAGAQLWAGALSGQHFKTAQLDLSTPLGQVYATYALQDVQVTKLQDDASGTPGDIPTETLSLSFGKATVASQGQSTCIVGELGGVC